MDYSAEIAGLNVLGFIKDNTAAALFYGIDRIDENSTHTVIFYNIGSYYAQASLVQYKSINSTSKSNKKPIETLTVLADSGLSDSGGLSFDLIIANYFAD